MASSSGMSMHRLRADLATRTFFTVPETAKLLGMDERTIRAACKRGPTSEGGIPSVKVGSRYLIPTVWLRRQVAGRQDGNDGRAA